MSPGRRLLVAVLAVLVALGAVVAGVAAFVNRGPAVDPGSRPAQGALGPVLLVPGYGGSRESLATLAARIEETGRDAQVLALVGDGTGDLSAQVRVLDDAVDDALRAGAPSVDVIGYSAGGVVTGLWVARDDGAAKARRVITLGSPLNGTTLAASGVAAAPDLCPTACRQLAPGSAELAEIAGVGGALPWLSIRTADDETSTPPETAVLAGAVNVAVQDLCPGARVGHSALPGDTLVAGLVMSALGPDPIDVRGDCAEMRAAGS